MTSFSVHANNKKSIRVVCVCVCVQHLQMLCFNLNRFKYKSMPFLK